MIRPATPEDLRDLLDMSKRFHAQTGSMSGFDPDHAGALLLGWMQTGIVLRSAKGFIAGMVAPAFCDPSWKIAIEAAWWSEDRRGLDLLKGFEDAAKAQGANEVRMTSICSLPTAATVLARRGYTATEISHAKVL